MGFERSIRFWFAVLLGGLAPFVCAAAHGGAKTVRIGFFESRGMYNGAGEGLEKSGYCYEYMTKLAARAGWKYEFRYGPFSTLYGMLRKGEIDVLPYVSINETRQKEVLFSETALVDEEYYLVSGPAYGPIATGGLQALNGAVISTVEGWDYNRDLADFLRKNAPAARLKYYPELTQIWDAHRAGESDVTVFSSIAYSRDDWRCICSFSRKPAYVAVARQKPWLKEEVDAAMDLVDREIPPVRQILAEKYFPDSPVRRMLDARNFWNPIVISELVSGLFLVFVMLALFLERDDSTSSRWLKHLSVITLVWLLADVMSYSARLKWCPVPLAWLANFLAFDLGNFGLVFTLGFSCAYIREMTPLGRWWFRVPAVAAVIAIAVVAVEFCCGRILIFQGDQPRIVGGVPSFVSLIQFAVLAYLPAMAFVKRKAVGMRTVALLGVYSVIPVVTLAIAVLTGDDYSVSACTLAIVFVAYQLHRMLVEKRLIKMNDELREANDRLTRYRQVEAANAAKSYFFSMVSHDIRTPLNAIIGYAELLKLGIVDRTEREEAIDSVLASGHTLLELINDVLDLSKLEAGKMDIVPEPVDVVKLVKEVARAFRVTLKGRPVEIRTDVQPMPWLLVDPHRIRQILFNLVSNAVKFTERGHVEIKVLYAFGALGFEVSDTGCGISPENLERITQAYIQVGTSANRGKGTGLGLAICKQLATRMGGELRVHSTVGVGSVFSVQIPGVLPAPERDRQDGSAGVAAPISKCGYRSVLIVDDQAMNRMMLRSMLKRFGISEVEEAENGVVAMKKLSARSFDLVLTDMWMPEMDGEALIRNVRANPAWAKLPVYAVTADIEVKKDCDSSGFTGILLKPLTFEKVKQLLDTDGDGARREDPV